MYTMYVKFMFLQKLIRKPKPYRQKKIKHYRTVNARAVACFLHLHS